MPMVQTELTPPEHELLSRYARSHGLSVKDVVRDLVRGLVMPDTVAKDDPLLTGPPSLPRRGRQHANSEDHDQVLYGPLP